MTFTDYQLALSIPRLDKYLNACLGDNQKAIEAYKTNIRLSQSVFGALSVFEVTLRNQIDNHYIQKFSTDWLRQESSYRGFLTTRGCEKSLASVNDVITKLGNRYTHHEAVAQLGFSFWRYLFASKEYLAAGSSLLSIFPDRPLKRGINQTAIFDILSDINRIRNRIAHHEPICFNNWKRQPIRLSDDYAKYDFNNIIKLLKWMSFDTIDILKDVSAFDQESQYLKSI